MVNSDKTTMDTTTIGLSADGLFFCANPSVFFPITDRVDIDKSTILWLNYYELEDFCNPQAEYSIYYILPVDANHNHIEEVLMEWQK